MLFNSFEFLFGLLPVAFLGASLLIHFDKVRLAVAFLVLSSLFFYGWWNPSHLWVILASITLNFTIGNCLAASSGKLQRLIVLWVGITYNLAILGIFKYTGFVIGIFTDGPDIDFMENVILVALPIGISFYTFQQIAFLVDAYNQSQRYDIINYAFFVCFFPQLIAGPIVHHSEIIPQLSKIRDRLKSRRYVPSYLAPGLALLSVGLAKKLILADQFGEFSDRAFAAVAQGINIGFVESWGGSLAYSLQIYFDFSAYSDMAIGLGLLFGVALPINFNSPYRATSIIDFWRRWHITLSRFLRDYLYVPLGGNRRGANRRMVNLMITMLLGGLWHGASWTFVVWGGLHGVLLVLNHWWRQWLGWKPPNWLSVPVTFLLVAWLWVPFRADSFGAILEFWTAMLGFEGIAVPARYGPQIAALGPIADWLNIHPARVEHFGGLKQIGFIAFGLVVVWGSPNAMSLLRSDLRRRFLATPLGGIALGALAALSLIAIYVQAEVTFLYFRF